MILKEISNTRLTSQKIETAEFNTAREIVSQMGAIQAQDYSMAKWALGIRLPDWTDKKIESSIDNGEIIRTHVLRPTWHFIPADDIYWMLQLTSQKIRSSLKARHKGLELTESVIKKTNSVIEKSLLKEKNLTREELADVLNRAKIKTNENNRLAHVLLCAELGGIICSGPMKKNKMTYSLLSERVPVKKILSRDESLAELAKRYFTSRCPATIQDFIWWSNLSVTDARKATESIKSGFFTERIGTAEYWFPNSFSIKGSENTSVHLLPAYDEFLISYRDRSSSLSSIHNKKTISNNGMFYPAIVINGQVAGLWKRIINKNKIVITTDFFQPPDNHAKNLTVEKAEIFGRFLGKEAEIH
jgi:hypothetical protein